MVILGEHRNRCYAHCFRCLSGGNKRLSKKMLAAGAAAVAEQCKTIALFLHMLGSHVIKTFFSLLIYGFVSSRSFWHRSGHHG